VDAEVVEARAPQKLVTTYSMLIDPNLAAEGFTTVTYDIKEVEGGFCPLTVTHDVTGAPNVGALVAGEHEESRAGGGWSWILSDLKSLLETGTTLAGQA